MSIVKRSPSHEKEKIVDGLVEHKAMLERQGTLSLALEEEQILKEK